MAMRFDGRVAIVTGAGGGLGREHALALAKRGARVVVNDLGGARDGSGGSATAAEAVVAEIEAAGGEAMANAASVTDAGAVNAMVDAVMTRWDRVDILVNNAGVLRDKTFAKMELEDFRFVVDVHLMGAVNCTKAVWDHMREASYGRIDARAGHGMADGVAAQLLGLGVVEGPAIGPPNRGPGRGNDDGFTSHLRGSWLALSLDALRLAA